VQGRIVIARSEATKQSSSAPPHWIASLTLAMTRSTPMTRSTCNDEETSAAVTWKTARHEEEIRNNKKKPP
jgi:hypothetical protein